MPASLRPSYSPTARPRRPLWHPPGIPKINFSNPLSHGLAFCWVSCGGKNINLVNGQVTPDNLARVSSQYGEATNFTTTNGASWTGPQISAASDFTIGALLNAPSTSVNANGDVVYSQRNASPLICDLRVNYAYDTNATANGIVSVLAYNGSLLGAKSTAAQTDGVYHLFAGKRAGSAFSVYRDGINITAGSATSAASFSATDQTTMLGDEAVAGGAILNAPGVICAGWNRALSDAELLKWAKSPFGFLSWPEDRRNYLVGVAAAAATIFWGYDPEATFPERRRAQRMLLQDEPIWPRTVVATPTQFGWNNPEQFAKRQIIRGVSRQDVDITTIPIAPTVIQSGWDNPEQFAKRQIVRSVSRQDVDTIVVSTTPTTQVGWDNPERFAIRSRRGTFQNQDDEFQFTAVPTPAQLSFPWEPQFPVRRKIDALQSPDDEFLLITATQTPTQQGFAWEPQFPVRKRFTTFQSPDDEFKFTAIATPTQFGWYIDPQFAERRKHRFLINPADEEWLFTAIKTPTQLGWHTDPQFARRLKLLLKLWEEEGDGPFKPPAGAVANVQHLLMLLGFGR